MPVGRKKEYAYDLKPCNVGPMPEPAVHLVKKFAKAIRPNYLIKNTMEAAEKKALKKIVDLLKDYPAMLPVKK